MQVDEDTEEEDKKGVNRVIYLITNKTASGCVPPQVPAIAGARHTTAGGRAAGGRADANALHSCRQLRFDTVQTSNAQLT